MMNQRLFVPKICPKPKIYHPKPQTPTAKSGNPETNFV